MMHFASDTTAVYEEVRATASRLRQIDPNHELLRFCGGREIDLKNGVLPRYKARVFTKRLYEQFAMNERPLAVEVYRNLNYALIREVQREDA